MSRADELRRRMVARSVSLAWAIVVAVGLLLPVATGPSSRSLDAGMLLIAAAVIVAWIAAWLPWRWEPAGGLVLLAVGVGFLVAPLTVGGMGVLARLGIGLGLGLPPLVAGWLFVGRPLRRSARPPG